MSHVNNSTDFLNKLPKNVSKDSELITFDVTSLYTRIPHTLGLRALEYWINKCHDIVSLSQNLFTMNQGTDRIRLV